MSKKKAGKLSGSMVVRRRGKEDVGFVMRESEPVGGPETSDVGVSDPPLNEPAPLATTGTAIDPVTEHSGDADESETPQAVADDSPVADDQIRVLPSPAEHAGSGKVVALYPERKPEAREDEPETPDFSEVEVPNPDKLVEALRSADIAEAEDIFASMTGLTHVEVLRLLYGPDGNDLALACRALGMEQLQFVSVYILSRKLGLGEEALDPRELARVVAFFEATDETEAVAALAAWRAAEEEGAGKPVGPV